MKKNNFFSKLFKKVIYSSVEDYEFFVLAETLYRIWELEIKDCSCMECKNELLKYKNYLKKLELKYFAKEKLL